MKNKRGTGGASQGKTLKQSVRERGIKDRIILKSERDARFVFGRPRGFVKYEENAFFVFFIFQGERL